MVVLQWFCLRPVHLKINIMHIQSKPTGQPYSGRLKTHRFWDLNIFFMSNFDLCPVDNFAIHKKLTNCSWSMVRNGNTNFTFMILLTPENETGLAPLFHNLSTRTGSWGGRMTILFTDNWTVFSLNPVKWQPYMPPSPKRKFWIYKSPSVEPNHISRFLFSQSLVVNDTII